MVCAARCCACPGPYGDQEDYPLVRLALERWALPSFRRPGSFGEPDAVVSFLVARCALHVVLNVLVKCTMCAVL